jgi:hypothetical protein
MLFGQLAYNSGGSLDGSDGSLGSSLVARFRVHHEHGTYSALTFLCLCTVSSEPGGRRRVRVWG